MLDELKIFSPRTLTGVFILAVIGAIIAYDAFAYMTWGTGATISHAFSEADQKYPLSSGVFAFAAGCLYGHFFL